MSMAEMSADDRFITSIADAYSEFFSVKPEETMDKFIDFVRAAADEYGVPKPRGKVIRQALALRNVQSCES